MCEQRRNLSAELAGDSLRDGEYLPIPIERVGARELRGYSRILQLYVCWEDGNLRFCDPEEDAYLLTYRGRLIAEAERDEERERRVTAEAERRAAQARICHLEERIWQLGG